MPSAPELFRIGVEMGCSDIHLKPGSPPKVRVNGRLIPIPGMDIITAHDSELFAHATMNPRDQATFEHDGFNMDYSWDLERVGRFRMNASKTRGHVSIVARLLTNEPTPLDNLGVAPVVKDLALLKTGVVIVSGATGSGKSTTMSAMIDHINKTKDVNIISAEDPIETLHRDYRSSVSQREIGVDVPSFSAALKYALRQDPDVILIGEVRDIDTLRTVLLAADTGHLVVTTLHTTDTAETINRIISMFPANERHETRRALSSVLRGVVGQRLVPSVNGKRTVVNEILLNTPEMTDIILDETKSAKDIKALIRASQYKGMQTFEQGLERLIKDSKITLEVARENSNEPEYFNKIAQAIKEERKQQAPKPPTHVHPFQYGRPQAPAPAVKPAFPLKRA